MTEDEAWYLIARNAEDNKPTAMVHFRFDIDEDEEVLYWLVLCLYLFCLLLLYKKYVSQILFEECKTFFLNFQFWS